METKLKTWRTRADRSAKDVADALGVTLAMWSRWETGRRRVPAERVVAVSQLTGIPKQDLRPDLARIFAEPATEHRKGAA